MAKTKRSAFRPLITLGIFILIAAIALGVGAARKLTSPTPELALDLQGGTQLILTPTAQEGAKAAQPITEQDLNQAIEILRKRVDASGVAEAEITSQGGRNIVVSLPGQPSEETLDLVRSSAVMVFRPVLLASHPTSIGQDLALQQAQATATPSADPSAEPSEQATEAETATATPTPSTEASAAPTAPPVPVDPAQAEAAARQAADRDGDGELSDKPAADPVDASDQNWITEKLLFDFLMTDCTDPAAQARGSAADTEAPTIACGLNGDSKYLLGPVELEGKHLKTAAGGQERNAQGATTGRWVVHISFDSEGAKIFGELSKRLYDLRGEDPTRSRFAMVLDGNVISAPSMNAAIYDGNAEISGDFTPETARTLANQLQFGSLPLNFTVESERAISATLGADHLVKGLWAGLAGLVLVVLYLIWQYRGLSVIAAGSLLVAAVIVYLAIALLSWLMGYRLSLAGVTGLIIAIGITADSFIVYFERIRDEVRSGQPLQTAVRTGWVRARLTIIISDMVNLLAAIVLYFLAVGGVQGFAFTLGLTTVVDLVVILMFTHPMMVLLIRTKFFGGGHRLSGLDPEHLGATSAAVYRGRGQVRLPAGSGKDKTNRSGIKPQMKAQPGYASIAQRRREAQLEAQRDNANEEPTQSSDTTTADEAANRASDKEQQS
ncbi:MAG: protein translocase subunit SecD [Actinomycetaceae bacterium]|nr:protein translocase subunit SecD [Actinomycetaceae bacterium]